MGLNKYRTTTVSVSNAPSRAKMKTQDGDIVIALTRPHRGAIAQIKESGVISSTGFSVIRKVVTQIDREWLLFVLLSNLSLQQMLQRSSGGNYPAIIEDEVKRIYIPIVDYSKQLQMAANMRTKAKEFDAQIQTSNSFLNNTLFILERVGLTFDKDNNNLAFAITRSIVEDRIDADYYSPRFVSFRNQIEQSRFPAIPVGEISEKIVSGFAAGKQDQADDLPEDQRVPHLRPFSITPEGELSFETKKYVPKSRLKSEDYCKKNEVKQRIDAAKNKNNNGVVVYPTKQPYEELDQVGYWCLLNVLKAKDFQEFLGNSEAFDFYCEYAKFDFSRFDVSWLLNLYPHTLEQIAKNAKVKERVRVAIATTLDGEAIAPSDSQRLQSILVKHFC